MDSHGNVTGGSPRELNLVAVDVGALRLRVDALHHVAVGKVPASCSLRLVEPEVALEVGAVRVEPLAVDELSVFEFAHVLLACFEEDVGALAIFLSIGPVARVDVFVEVSHDSLAVPLAVLPVAVVLAHLGIHLLANAVLEVVNPGTLVLNGFVFGSLGGVGVVTLAVTFLSRQNVSVTAANLEKRGRPTYAIEEVTSVCVTVRVVRSAAACVVSR